MTVPAQGPVNALPAAGGETEIAAAFRSFRGAFLGTGLFSFVINLLMLAGPLYMMQIYDRVLLSGSVPTLVALTLLIAALYSFLGIFEFLRSRVLVRIGALLDRAVSGRVFEALVRKAAAGQGAAEQPLRDLDQLRQFLSGPGPFAFFDAPWTPLYLIVVFLFHPLLGLVAAGGAGLLLVLALMTELLSRGLLREASGASVRAAALADGGRRNAEVLETMGLRAALIARWSTARGVMLAKQARASDRVGTLTAFSKTFRLFLQSAILGTGAYLAIDQVISPGAMIAASILTSRALAPIEQAIAQWRPFVQARQGHGRLAGLLAAFPREGERLDLPPGSGRLEVAGLTVLAPGTRSAILSGISFTLAPGEAVGVIGPSASGKSTLVRAVTGIWPAAGGAVRLDGARLEHIRREARDRLIGYLPQEVELFEGSVAGNIARFAPAADDAAVTAAAQRAGVHEMILQLPEGYETDIGAGGAKLSAGQRQRVALARALYGDPPLLVLDEPNANLDHDGDRALTQALLACKANGQAVLVVAHRQSAIAGVDQLLVLDQGHQRAFGPKEEVLRRETEQSGATPMARPRGLAVEGAEA